MFRKRLCAYIIDILILSLIVGIICLFVPVSSNVNVLNDGVNDLLKSYIDESIGFRTFLNQYASYFYDLDKCYYLSNLITVIVSLCYFVLLPVYKNGQTFGKKLMGICINLDDSVNMNNLLVRYLFMSGIGTSIISLVIFFVLKDIYYLLVIGIFGFSSGAYTSTFLAGPLWLFLRGKKAGE